MTRFTLTTTDRVTVSGLPVAGPITSMFGAQDIALHAQGHSGCDIAAAEGTPVCAPADGTVKDVFSLAIEGAAWAQAWKDVFGNSVILAHGDFVTLYGHMSQPPSVIEGQQVHAGDLLGYVGTTGESTGPHLHWGMAPASNGYLQRDGLGGLVDPLDFLGAPPVADPAASATAPVDLAALRARLQEALAMLP